MTYSQLLSLMRDTHQSPEKLAPVFGVSNMTIRRWKKQNPKDEVPASYLPLIMDGIYKMIITGQLRPEQPSVRAALAGGNSLAVAAAVHSMGLGPADFLRNGNHQTQSTKLLRKLGLSESHRLEVHRKRKKILSFQKLGADWTRLIAELLKVLRSTKFTTTEKLVAYGALFYLICPFDLIPDHIPIFGLVDDFAMLSLAASYYRSRLKKKETAFV